MPNTIPEFKRRVFRAVLGMFVVLILALCVGLYTVQEKAKEYAAEKATALAIKEARKDSKQRAKDAAQDRYQIRYQNYTTNKTACGIRSLIDLDAQLKLQKTNRDALKDTSLSAATIARTKERIKVADKQIRNSRKIIKTFGKIPDDFDCSKLPAKPPVKPKA